MPFPIEKIHFELLTLTEKEGVELIEMKFEIENSEDGMLQAHSYEYNIFDVNMEFYICENSHRSQIIFTDNENRFFSIADFLSDIKKDLLVETTDEKSLLKLISDIKNLIDNDVINRTTLENCFEKFN
jgi:hypothetical protein